MLEDLLKSGDCFKLICGAGKEDIEEVRRLVYIYALAGCRFFDVSANIDVIKAAKNALKKSAKDGYICVSVGIKGDPHSNKAVIDYTKCTNCGMCESICPEKAILNAKIEKSKCIGCGRCLQACPENALSYTSEEKDLKEVLPEIIAEGIDCIEFHVIGQDENEIFSKWEFLNNHFDGILSICLSRNKLGDEALIERIDHMIKFRKPYTTIIQADGFPMSGGIDNYKSTLQAVAAAEIVYNAKLPVYLTMSGGTNSKTAELAKLCEIPFDGIAIGSYARSLIREFIDNKNFWADKENIDKAVKIAKNLILKTK